MGTVLSIEHGLVDVSSRGRDRQCGEDELTSFSGFKSPRLSIQRPPAMEQDPYSYATVPKADTHVLSRFAAEASNRLPPARIFPISGACNFGTPVLFKPYANSHVPILAPGSFLAM